MSENQSSRKSQTSRRSIYVSPLARKTALRNVLNKTNYLSTCGIAEYQRNPDTLNNLSKLFDEVDEIHEDWRISGVQERIQHADEILMDSQVMSASSKVIGNCLTAMSQGMDAYVPTDYVEKILQHMRLKTGESQEDINWKHLENEALGFFKTTPTYSIILPQMFPKQQPPTTSQLEDETENRHQIHEEKEKEKGKKVCSVPENVVQLEEEEQSVEDSIHHLYLTIKRVFKAQNKQPISFFKIVLDPFDFSKSIENIFHVSFLVRDGRVRLIIGQGGDLMVVLATFNDRFEADKVFDSTQNIISLSPKQWECLVKHYNITEPFLN